MPRKQNEVPFVIEINSLKAHIPFWLAAVLSENLPTLCPTSSRSLGWNIRSYGRNWNKTLRWDIALKAGFEGSCAIRDSRNRRKIWSYERPNIISTNLSGNGWVRDGTNKLQTVLYNVESQSATKFTKTGHPSPDARCWGIPNQKCWRFIRT